MLQPKDIDWLNGYKNKTCIYVVYKRPTSLRNTYRLKMKGWKKIFHLNGNQKKTGAAIHVSQKIDFKIKTVGLPWWCSGWESACQCRGHGFEPWSWKIPHATEQLGPCTTTTEPAHLEPVLRNKRGRDSERPAHWDEEWSPLATTTEPKCQN